VKALGERAPGESGAQGLPAVKCEIFDRVLNEIDTWPRRISLRV
jgi:hypothetical protein